MDLNRSSAPSGTIVGGCGSMKLPIDVDHNTDPPVFRWSQVVDSPNGKHVIQHEGTLPITLERAVERLITIVKQVLADNASLQGIVQSLSDRVANQSALLSKAAEKQKKGG